MASLLDVGACTVIILPHSVYECRTDTFTESALRNDPSENGRAWVKRRISLNVHFSPRHPMCIKFERPKTILPQTIISLAITDIRNTANMPLWKPIPPAPTLNSFAHVISHGCCCRRCLSANLQDAFSFVRNDNSIIKSGAGRASPL